MFVLSERQQEVVDHDNRRILVTARPGCGKTTTIAHRVARLSRSRADGETGALCVTHSRAAVAAMTAYTESLIGRITEPTVITTFHSFAESILRAYGHHIGLDHLTLIDTEDARATALRLALAEVGISQEDDEASNTKALLDAISASLRGASAATTGEVNGSLNLEVSEVVSIYTGFLRATHTVDFDLLLIMAAELLTDNPSIRNHYHRMYGHVIVDEAQDTSSLQLDLLSQLIGPKTKSVSIFLDPGQRVNAWLGVPEGLQDRLTENFHLEPHPIVLAENFRNSNPILELANAVRDSSSFAHYGGVEIARTSSDGDEAKHVTTWVHDQIADPEIESVAILGRSSWLLTPTEILLRAEEVNVWHPVERNNVFSSPSLQALLPVLRWLSSPDNAITQRELNAELGITGSPDVHTVARKFTEKHPDSAWIGEVLTAGKANAAARLEDEARLQLGKDSFSDDAESTALADDLQRLADRLRERRLKSASNQQGWTSIYQTLTEPRQRPNNSIWVGSIHAAKGLEFDAVAIVGLTQGGLPDFRSKTTAQLNEERRLFYVAITRARKRLLVTSCKTRTAKTGREYSTEPSIFLAGIS